MNLDEIYFELQRFKSEKAWYNLDLPKRKIGELLSDDSWYTLYIPPSILECHDFKQVRVWQQIALALLRKYCEKFYNYKRAEAESPHMKYVELTGDDDNFIEGDQYLIRLDPNEDQILKLMIESLDDSIRKLRDAIAKGDFKDIPLAGFTQEFKPIFFSQHLYHPLIAASGIEVRPVALNPGERQFVEDLRDYYQQEKDRIFAGKELYLLRNRSRGRGIGFFEAGNFHPDFILWILHEDVQYITFVDPKGVRNEPGLHAPKLQFHQTIKERQKNMGDNKIVLNSFILSRTAWEEIKHWEGGVSRSEVEKANVLFLADGGDVYLPRMFRTILPS